MDKQEGMLYGKFQDSASDLYGMTSGGGNNDGTGTVFNLDSSGTKSRLYSFGDGSDGNFYGTTYAGGSNAIGTVFKMNVSGSVSVLHSFEGNDPGFPATGLILGSNGCKESRW